jgi:hypothetical protein
VPANAATLSLDDTAHSTVGSSVWEDGGGHRLSRQVALSPESLQGSPG